MNSPITDDLIHVFRLVHLLNKRYLEKLKEEWWNSDVYKSECEEPADQSEGITFQNIGGVFIVIFVGISMACITLMFEYCVHKYRKTPKIQYVLEAKLSKMGFTSNPTDTNERRFCKETTQKGLKLRTRHRSLHNNFRPTY